MVECKVSWKTIKSAG